MSNGFEVPAGFVYVEDTTTADGHTYPVEFLQAESLQAILDYYASEGLDAETVVRDIWNAANKQGATQSPKTPLRKALSEGEGVEEAVASAQESTRTHIIGAPRGRSTKSQHRNFGEALAEFVEENGRKPTPDELASMYESMIG